MWYVRYFEDRVRDGQIKHDRVAKQIGEVTTRGKRPPQQIIDEAQRIVSEASVTNTAPNRVLTVKDFMGTRISPAHESVQTSFHSQGLPRYLGEPHEA